jgi:hypothetical protein
MNRVEPNGGPHVVVLLRELYGGLGRIELRTDDIHPHAFVFRALNHLFSVVLVRDKIDVRMRIKIFHNLKK